MRPEEIERIVRRVVGALAPAHGHRAAATEPSVPPAPLAPPATAADVARLIDHTLLRPEATRAQIEALCGEAVVHGFATVCVNPVWVAACARLLHSSPVGVCTVAGFPLGASAPDVKQYEARRAIMDGAREVDMVINVGALRSGELREVADDIAGVVRACHEHGAVCKVIIEAALLTDEEKVIACTLARLAGVDYVKTSTGFGPGGATTADVSLMRLAAGSTMGVKAAGGIRNLAALRSMVAAGATRIGTSTGVAIVSEVKRELSAEARDSGAA